ncbi:electron transfer flavoprotein subunit beta/FixA family protein [Anaerosphaera multitolerans]|nr:electron transfer flavoprotein subunit beta/FixA family protein [Anaerosphaera multitolerans]
MEYLVCVKEVPKGTKVKLDPVTHNLIREGTAKTINPADLNALTFALKLKEKTGGRVTVMTMGPDSAADSIRKCYAMGADRGYVISGRCFAGSDTLATAYTLALGARHIGDFDVIFTGNQTIDGDTGQVGPELAENLGINQVTYVEDIDCEDGKFKVKRQNSEGEELVEVKSPVVFTIVRNANIVKIPKKDEIEAYADSEVTIIGQEDLDLEMCRVGVEGSPTVVDSIFEGEKLEVGTMVEGDSDEKIDSILEILLDKGFIGR